MKKISLIFLLTIFLILTACNESHPQVKNQEKVDISFCDGLSDDDWNMCVINIGLVKNVNVCNRLPLGEDKRFCDDTFSKELQFPSGYGDGCIEGTVQCQLIESFGNENKKLIVPRTQQIVNETIMEVFYIKNTFDSNLNYNIAIKVINYIINYSSDGKNIQKEFVAPIILPSKYFIDELNTTKVNFHALKIKRGNSLPGTYLAEIVISNQEGNTYDSKVFFITIKP